MELLTMNGYGQFVWTAYIFSFVSCLYLYFKTSIEFKKQEKIYLLEVREVKARKFQFEKKKKFKEEVLSIN